MRRVAQWLGAVGAVMGKELYAYAVSPMAYVVTAVFLLVNGLIFFLVITYPGAEANLNGVMPSTAFLLLLMIPVLTMRLLAEEMGTGTIELLMTFPLTDSQVVVGKFLATFIVYCLMLVPTLFYVLVVRVFGGSSWGPLISTYIGLILLGGTCVSLGMLGSSLTRNQIVAAVLGIGILLMLWVIGALGGMLEPRLSALVSYFSLPTHYEPFGRGVIDLKDVVFFLSVIVGALFLTTRILESNRWRA